MSAVAEDAFRVEHASGEEFDEDSRFACPGNERQRRAFQPANEVLVVAAWVALVTGFAEGLYWLVQSRILGSLIFMHPGFLWMSPLAQLAFFALPGILLASAAWLRPGRDLLPFSATLLALLGWLNLLLLVPGLTFWAWILAGCGLATASGRFFRNHQDRCLRFIHRTVTCLGILLLLVAAVQVGLVRQHEANTVASLPAAQKEAPNILLIVLDTVRADALGLYGDDREVAPNISRLAEQGVVFEQAWSTSPWTLPSHAGMFTGAPPHALSTDWLSALGDSHATLAEELSARGWLTGGFVGNTRYCSAETGLARGFTHYEDYRLSLANCALCSALGRKFLFSNLAVRLGIRDWPGRKPAWAVNDEFSRWLNRREGRPFFAFLNYWDAHDPFIPPPGFRTCEPTSLDEALFVRNWWWVHKKKVSDGQVKALRQAYEDCVRGIDSHLGRLLERLRQRGELENTLVIITSDHGEQFAEHNLFLHGNSLYEPVLHVPLIVVWPGKVPAGMRVQTPVSLSGLPNTIMELVGAAQRFPGDSWVRHWTGTRPVSQTPCIVGAELVSQAGHPPCQGRSPIAHGPMQCVRQGDLKLIRGGDGTEEVYDLAQDPREQKNLVDHPDYTAAIRRLRNSLTEMEPAGARQSSRVRACTHARMRISRTSACVQARTLRLLRRRGRPHKERP